MQPDGKRLGSRLIANSVWNLMAYVLATAVGIVSVPIYVRFLGIGQYGLMVILSSIIAPMGLLNLGFGQATIKYVAESIGRSDLEDAGCYVRTTLLFNLAVGALGMMLIALLANLLVTSVFRIDAANRHLAQMGFYWVAVGWLINQVSAVYQGVPAAAQKYSIVAIGMSLDMSGIVLVGLLALVLGGDLLTLIQSRVAWGMVSVLGWGCIARKVLPGVSLLPRWHRVAFRRSINFGVWQTLAGVGGLFASQTDRFILGTYVSMAAVGLYNIALTIQATMYGAIYRLGEVLFPAISDLQGAGQDKRAKQLMLRSGWILSTATIMGMGPLAVFAHDLLRLYMGTEIANSVAWLLQILAIAGMLSSGSVSVAQYLLGTGNTPWMAVISIASGVVILVGGLLLIPTFGLMGVGWTQILALVLSRPLIHAFLWRSMFRRDVTAQVFFAYLYHPAAIGIIGSLLLALLRMQLAWYPGWLGLATGMVVCALILLVTVLGTGYILPRGDFPRTDLRSLANLVLTQSETISHWSKPIAKLNEMRARFSDRH